MDISAFLQYSDFIQIQQSCFKTFINKVWDVESIHYFVFVCLHACTCIHVCMT